MATLPGTTPSFNFSTPSFNTALSFPSSYVPPAFTTTTLFGTFSTPLTGGPTTVNTSLTGDFNSVFSKGYVKGGMGDPNIGSSLFGTPLIGSLTGGGADGSVVTGSQNGGGNNLTSSKGANNAKVGYGLGMAADIGLNLVSAIAGPKMGSDGPNAGLTLGIDSAYDAASNAMMQVNPMVGGIMKAAGLAGNIINSVGGGTDGMTGVDAALNSAPMTLLTLGLNGFLGDTSETMTKDSEAFDLVGGSYGGTGDLVEDALSKAGKKYGLLSGGARDKANALIRKAKAQQSIMSDIAGSAKDSFAIQSSMTNVNSNRRANKLMGGYNLAAVRVGRLGLKIKQIVSAYNMSVKLLNGGKPKDPFEVYLTSLPENLLDTTDYRMRDYWEYNNRPKDFNEAVLRGMFTQQQDGWHAYSVQENPGTGEIEFMKSSSHPTLLKELDWYNSDEASGFRSKYELVKTEPYYKYVKRKGSSEPQSLKEGGIIREVAPSFKFKFQSGGSFNVIPEGALHARKHNMDMEGITNKGIPVVSKGEGGEIEQQAEIEREEIIFRLEVTKKLEELAEVDGTLKEKDEAAIEAGKLLVLEILYNTKDNTNSLI